MSVRQFFEKMLSSSGEVSSKRVAAFVVLINLIILAYISTYSSNEKITPEFMYDALALIAGGGLGLTVIEKIFTKSPKGGEIKTDSEKPKEEEINI